MTAWETIASGLRFPEGPVALADGSVLLVEIAAGRITRVGPARVNGSGRWRFHPDLERQLS